MQIKQDNYRILFSKITPAKAPAFVLSGIEARIKKAQIHRDAIRGTSYALVTCLAVLACVPAIKTMIESMVSSGFSSYFSMMITDGVNALGSWKELGMALVESLPILSIMAVLALVIGSLYSVSKSLFYYQNLSLKKI